MDQQLERKCLNLAENYRILSAGNKLEFTEMILACAGIYLAAGREPDMDRIQECKKLLKSKAGIFSNFRGSDELLVRCKMALSADPELYFENLEREYKRLKTFFSGEQTVLAAMILAEQLTTVSKHALRSYAGHISDADAMNRIETAVIAQLFLERRYSECL